MDIEDEVHCPVCLELYNEPKALSCLHSLCSQCAEQLKDGTEIPCPVCRESTSDEDIKSDFKTKRLVEIYKNSQNLKAETENESLKCDLCEEKPAELHCGNCKYNICLSCNKAHLKVSSDCEEKHCFGRSDIDKFMKLLNEKVVKLQTEKTTLTSAQDELFRQSESATDALLKELVEDECRTLQHVKQHYESLKETVKIKQEDTKRIMAKTLEEKIDTISARITDIDSLANSLEKAKYQNVLQKVETALMDLKMTKLEDALQQLELQKAFLFPSSRLSFVELGKVVDVGRTVMQEDTKQETEYSPASTVSPVAAWNLAPMPFGSRLASQSPPTKGSRFSKPSPPRSRADLHLSKGSRFGADSSPRFRGYSPASRGSRFRETSPPRFGDFPPSRESRLHKVSLTRLRADSPPSKGSRFGTDSPPSRGSRFGADSPERFRGYLPPPKGSRFSTTSPTRFKANSPQPKGSRFSETSPPRFRAYSPPSKGTKFGSDSPPRSRSYLVSSRGSRFSTTSTPRFRANSPKTRMSRFRADSNPSGGSKFRTNSPASRPSRFNTDSSSPTAPAKSLDFKSRALWAKNTRLQFQQKFKSLSKNDHIIQLLFVNRDLWVLDKNQNCIKILKEGDPDCVTTLNYGLKVVTDMCLNRLNHVVVATHSELVELTDEPKARIRCIEQGKFLCVTQSKRNTIWALKEKTCEDGGGSEISTQLHAFNHCRLLVVLKTSISSGGQKISCAALGEKLYCSVEADNRIYELSTETGRTLRKFGFSGYATSGYLNRPRAIYADESSQSLLVLDFSNRRLHVLHPDYSQHRWASVKTSGLVDFKPEACAVDEDRQLWLVGSVNNWIHQSQFIYKTVS